MSHTVVDAVLSYPTNMSIGKRAADLDAYASRWMVTHKCVYVTQQGARRAADRSEAFEPTNV
jgi:hypothetical protein